MRKDEDKVKTFSALEIANMCGVVNQTAVNWVKGGHLKAFVTPGGQYRIYSEDLAEFLKERKMKIPKELLPFIKEKIKKFLIIDSDKNFLHQIEENINKNCPNCDISTSSNGFDAGIFIVKEKPEYIIVSENIKDITIEKLRQLLEKDEEESPASNSYKIIYIKNKEIDDINNDLFMEADLVLVKPVDFSKINLFINSSGGKINDRKFKSEKKFSCFC